MRCALNQTQNIQKILLVRLSSLGDLFHALPSVHLLKKHLNAEIDWVTQPEYCELVDCFTDVRHVIPFHRRKRLKHFRSYLKAVRKEYYDCIIDMQGLMKSAVAARFARGKTIIGPSYQREGASLFYHAVAGTRNKDRHAVEEGLDVIRFLQLPVDEITFPVDFGKPPFEPVENAAALVPCSRWQTKNWPAKHFAKLGHLLLEQGMDMIYVTGAPADQTVCNEITRELPADKVHNLCGKTSLIELAALLKHMRIAVTVDSGPMHMAAALQTPLVALFGATEPKRTGPYGENVTVVEAEPRLNCQPCFSRNCKRHDMACLHLQVSPETVAQHTEKLLKQGTA